MGKIKITICAIALLSSMGRLMAQILTNDSIKGILVDQQQMSLPGATIVLKNSRDSSVVSITPWLVLKK